MKTKLTAHQVFKLKNEKNLSDYEYKKLLIEKMENETITTEKMIKLGFIEKPKSFKREGIRLLKHPTMNWLMYKQGEQHIELRDMKDVFEFIKKYFTNEN